MPLNIAAAIQSQMLQTLLQALQSADQPLKTGETVKATFVGWAATPATDAPTAVPGKPQLSEALVQIAGKPTTLLIEATPERQARMQPGTMLTLQVDTGATAGSPAQLRLMSIGPPRETTGGHAAAGKKDIDTPDVSGPTPASAKSPAEAARAAAGPLIGAALSRQTGFGPLYADLEVMARAPVQLPSPIARAAAEVLRLRTEADAIEGQPALLKTAVTSSGLLHDAMQAKGMSAEAATDLKGALVALRQALKDALAPSQPDGAPRTPADKPEARTSRQPDTAAAANNVRPQAPTRDGLPVPQGISVPSIAASDSAASMMAKVLERTEGAIDRISISQFASLPAASDASLGVPSNRLFVEVPLALDGRTAVLPLEIEEDHGGGSAAGAHAKLWRVRFALDIEPMGPLHAMVTMQGRAIGVTVWAERDATSQLVRDHAPDLKAALLDNDFENPQIEVLAGQPMKRAAHAGHYLDRRS